MHENPVPGSQSYHQINSGRFGKRMDTTTKINTRAGRLFRTPNRVRWLGAAIGLTCLIAAVWFHLPLRHFHSPFSTVIRDRNGILLGACIAEDEQWRFPPADSIPHTFKTAAICYEDKRFASHPGIDPIAVVRALLTNISARQVLSGASTISMQTIRLSRSNRPRTVGEKCIEAFMALRLEYRRSKKDIFRLYATHAPFGGNVVGLSAASWRYFGREPSMLSWGESALLAVLPNSPSLIHPGKNRRALKVKRDRLLHRLHQCGELDSMSAALAMQEPLPPEPYPMPVSAPHLLFRIRNQTPFGKAQHTTTLDWNLQVRVNEIVDRHHARLSGNGIYNASVMIIDIPENQVRAYAGNISDFADTEHGYQVDIIRSPRSTGSILKPFLYAAMMQSGELLPGRLVADIPTRLGGFAPQNYSKDFDGAVPVASALARSLNIPATRLLHQFGVDRFHDLLTGLQLSTLHRPAKDYGLTLILGGAEATLWDITRMYAGLARRVNTYGQRKDTTAPFARPRFLLSDLQNEATAPGRVRTPLDAGSCYLTLQALLEVVRPNEERAWQNFASAKKIAWKTGTSYGFRDAWAVGVTSRHAVGVWVGNADGAGRPDLTGISAAAPLLFDVFSLLPDGEWFDIPEMDLRDIKVCAFSGYRKGPHCESSREALVHRSGLESSPCPYCRTIHCDRSGTWQVHDGCERVANMHPQQRFVLPPALEWYYKKRNARYRGLPPIRPDCSKSPRSPKSHSLSVIYPHADARIYVPRELDGSKGRTVFEAAHRNPDSVIFWYLDESYVGKTSSIHQLALDPDPGAHTLTLVDERGETVRRPFTVLSRDG